MLICLVMKEEMAGLFMRRRATVAARRTAAEGLLTSAVRIAGFAAMCWSAKIPAWRR